MRRRDFVAGIGIAAAWPLLAHAQQKMHRIGILLVNDARPMGPVRESLRDLGYVENANTQYAERSAGGVGSRLPELAQELVRDQVDVILAVFTPSIAAAKNATRDIPIVMAPGGDPVATGFVASLARPGGNITGVSATAPEAGVKSLELIGEILPAAKHVAVLANARDPFTPGFVAELERAAAQLRMDLRVHRINSPGDYEPAFEAIVREGGGAVFFQGSIPPRPTLELALKHRVPAISPQKSHGLAGALMTYSASDEERGRAIAGYVDKILKGASPAELPVQQPTRYELLINLKTAKALGIDIPLSLQLRADALIE